MNPKPEPQSKTAQQATSNIANPLNLSDILLKENYISKEALEKATQALKKEKISLEDYLLREGLITREILGQAIAESYKVPFTDLVAKRPSKELVLMVPFEVANSFKFVVSSTTEAAITIAASSPANPQVLAAIKSTFPEKPVKITFAFVQDIEELFINYRKPLETRFAEIVQTEERVAPEIIEQVLDDAVAFRASDVHFEPQEAEVLIRFRVDGVLHEAGRIKKDLYENILNRVKVQSRLRIDEHFSAQDGSFRYQKDSNIVDLRVSIIPTMDGEKIAFRLLGQYVRSFTTGDLGFSANDQKTLAEASHKPYGMILVVGPTGSGKTTTLYALLKILNKPEVNITTIEDPVEYKIQGVNQIQVNIQTELTFAKGLRSIVRQDPDVILVGEIRDTETAEIAVNAALTGHLLLSTFHANDAATALPRLLDMDVEPFLLASTLQIIIAQRLVRKICTSCRISRQEKREDIIKKFPAYASYFPQASYSFYAGKGCESCNRTGYKGRGAIFEIIKITREMEDLILSNPSTKQIWDLARSQGSISMFEDGIEKVSSGVTTLEELIRVAAPPETSLNINKTPLNGKRQKQN